MPLLPINEDIQTFLNQHNLSTLSTIDLGNSHPHIGHFKNGQLTNVSHYNGTTETQINITSSVTGHIKTNFNPLWKNNTFCQMPVHYAKTLGADRLHQAAFLYNLYPEENIVCIDAGTFMTIDFINHDGFNGGFIFAGIQTYLSAYQKGQHLPAISSKQFNTNKKDALPSNTEEAILEAVKIYVSSILSSLKEKFVDHRIILTGGESQLILPILPNAELVPHLIHYSLYYLYQQLEQGEAQ